MALNQLLTQNDQSLFEKMIMFDYEETVLDKDMVNLLKNGIYKPSYTPLVQPFLEQEGQNFLQYMPDTGPITLSLNYLGNICNKNMQPSPVKINRFLQQHQITDPEQQHIFRTNINKECFGSGFIHAYQTESGQKKNIYFYDMVEAPFYTTYTFAHELTHAMQDKHHFNGYDDCPKNPKILKHLPDYREIHANLTAGTFMMIKALQTKKPEVIEKTQHLLLNYASTMSGSLKRGDLGVRYFDWRGIKKVMKDLPKQYLNLLTSKGTVDWEKLYSYTTGVLKSMDYTPQKIEEFQKQLKPEWKNQSFNTTFLSELKPCLGQNEIFDDFYEAAQHLITHPKTPKDRLQQFYQMLANPIHRKDRLFVGWADNLPHMDEYRKIYSRANKPSPHTR